MILGELALELDDNLVDANQPAVIEPDYRALFHEHGIRCTPKELCRWKGEAEVFLDRLEDVLWPAAASTPSKEC